MFEKTPEIVSLKSLSPNPARGITGPYDTIDIAHSPLVSLSPVARGANELGGHPPPPPPHSPPPPNPKSARLHECAFTPNVVAPKPEYPPPPPPHSPPLPNPKSAGVHECAFAPNVGALKPGYPPPPPPHSPPPPPPPRSQSGNGAAMAPELVSPANVLALLIYAYAHDARIYSTKAMPLGGNTPKPPRPELDPASPPLLVGLNNALGAFTGDLLCPQAFNFGTNLLPRSVELVA